MRPADVPTLGATPAGGFAVTDAVPPHTGFRRVAGRWSVLVVALLVSVLPALLLVPHYVTHRDSYPAAGDHALMELQVRAIGHHPVLVGVFSREGWHHPGPALYYLIAGPYYALGQSSVTLPVVALTMAAASTIGIGLLLRRRLGPAVALWGLVVLAVYGRFAEPGFWRDVWNPTIPVLPFAVMVLLCWAFLDGDLLALAPLAAAIGSFAIQCHVGFFVPVIGVLGVTVAGCAVRARRSGGGVGRAFARRWGPLTASVAVTVVMWAPPVGQQIFDRHGNLGQIWDYLRSTKPTATPGDGVRQMISQLGLLPSYVSGRTPLVVPASRIPPQVPAWTGIVAVVCFAVAVVVAARLRHGPLLRLAALTAVITAAGGFAVSRVVGTVFAYLVQWAAMAGVLLWIMVGATAIVAVRRRADSPGTASAGLRAARFVAALAAVAMIAVPIGYTTRDTYRTTPGTSAYVPPLSAAVVRWLGPHHNGVRVHVDPAPAPAEPGVLVDPTLGVTPGLVLALRKAGVTASVSAPFENAYAPWLVDDSTSDTYRVVVAHAAYPPPDSGRLLATFDGLTVWGGPAPRP